MRLKPEQLLYHLQLIRSENIGPCRYQALLRRFGSAEAAMEALEHNAAALFGKSAKKPIIPASRAVAEQELAYAEKIGARFIALPESDYPLYMREIDSPPPLLAVKGNISLLQRPAVAIVGARDASAVGRRLSCLFARRLGEAGFVICSGFARGIDAHAHKAALEHGTIAVVAGGVDYIYPPENESLYQEILAQGGVFISEMPLSWQPRANDFPRRNRLIAALALGLLVIEASERSGSLISARYAAEAGRLVFAAPGSPLDPRAKGANNLIKNGAALADDPQDIIDMLTPLLSAAAKQRDGASRCGEADEADDKTDADLFGGGSKFPSRPHPAGLDDKRAENRKTRPLPATEETAFAPPPPLESAPAAAPARPAAAAPADKNELTAEEKRILQESLSLTPIALDSLAQATRMPLSRLYLGLMELELAGRLIRHNGGMVSCPPD